MYNKDVIPSSPTTSVEINNSNTVTKDKATTRARNDTAAAATVKPNQTKHLRKRKNDQKYSIHSSHLLLGRLDIVVVIGRSRRLVDADETKDEIHTIVQLSITTSILSNKKSDDNGS